MKKMIVTIVLAGVMMSSLYAGCSDSSTNDTDALISAETSAAYSPENTVTNDRGASAVDTTSEKNFKMLCVWPEDSTEGKILIELTEKYIKEVNPNFKYEYEFVATADLSTKIATLVASNDLPDLFVYSAGYSLNSLIKSNKLVNISKALESIDCEDKMIDGVETTLLNLSDSKELYDIPFGMNVEGFWYNKSVFRKAGIAVPGTWSELLKSCKLFDLKGIQPIALGGADKWPATRLINAYAYRSLGKDAVKYACSGQTRFTDQGFVNAAQMIADMSANGYFGKRAVTIDNTTAETMLLDGTAAMLYDGSWFTSSIVSKKNKAGEDNIGFMGVPVVNENISPASELPMNCGNALCLSADKYDRATAGWLQYYVTHVGNYAMEKYQSIRGFKYDMADNQLSSTVKQVIHTIGNAKTTTAWWEAYMDVDSKQMAMDQVQSLLNGDLTGQDYCIAIQDTFDEYH